MSHDSNLEVCLVTKDDCGISKVAFGWSFGVESAGTSHWKKNSQHFSDGQGEGERITIESDS